MALDFQTLQDVDWSKFTSFGFADAEPYVGSAASNFANVRSAVASGSAWSGEGQPEAATVMRTNSLALQTAKIQMRAGKSAMEALQLAISRAQREAEEVLKPLYEAAEGTGFYIQVSPEGVASAPSGNPGYGTNNADRANLEGLLQTANLRLFGILNYARSADLTAAVSLRAIFAARPVFSANASGRALAYNAALRGAARANLDVADATRRYWAHNGPEDWRPVEPGSFDVWGAIKSALGIETPEDATETLADEKQDATLDLKLDTYGLGLAKGWKKGVPVFGTYFTILDGIRGGIVDPHLSNTDGPTTPDLPGTDVRDSYLQDLVDDYAVDDVPGAALSLAQAARLQRSGALDVEGRDYVEDARSLRARLSAWLHGGGPPNLPRSDDLDDVDDVATARRILHQLDAALGES